MMPAAVKMSDKSYFLPVVISVLMHGILLVLVVWGWESAELPKQKMTPRYVEATLVTIKPKTVQQAAPKPKPKVVDMAAKRKEQQRLQQAAEKKRLAQQKAERERLRKLAEEKARKEKEKKAKEQADKERLAKQRQEQERKRQQEQQRQKEAAFNDALKEEEALLAAQEDEVTAQSYVALMAQRIEQNWSRPPSARNGMKCELAIQLIPTGEVINVTVVKSSGNSAFDRAAEQAVKKIGRFDELKKVEPDVFERYFRQVTLVFNPQDLRL